MFQQKDDHKTSLKGRSMASVNERTVSRPWPTGRKYETGYWEESVSSQCADRIRTTNREEEVLAQLSATQEKFSKQRMDRKHTTTQQEKNKTGWYETSCWEKCVSSQWVERIKTTAVEEEATSATQEKSSKQRPERIYHATQPEKYKTGWYETNCWEESVSSQWVDRIKTISREDEVLAQSSATQEKGSKQRRDRKHVRIKTINREDEILAQSSATQEKFSKQRKDRKHITTQQEWVDRIKTPAVEEEASHRIKTICREDKVLVQSSAT